MALAAFATLAAPAGASAAFSMSGLGAAPASTAAGAHSDFTLQVSFPDAGTDVKDLTIHLPPGMVGDPTATPVCTVTELNGDNCPTDTQVGTVSTNVTVTVVGPVQLPLTVAGTLYNLTPQAGEPARFGIVLRPLGGLLPKIVLQSAVKLRPTDYGLDTVIAGIPNTASGLATHIDSMSVQLQGTADGHPFMRNPTSCTQATTAFDAVDYGGDPATGTASFTPTACSALDFSPTFTAIIGSPGHTKPATHPPLTTVVSQDNGEAGADEVDVVLPKFIGPDSNVVTKSCPLPTFTAGSCPANTIVGSATAASPLLTQALQGPVVLVEPLVAGNLPRLGLDLRGALHIQLFGTFTITASGPGNSFVGVPDIPLSRFALKFDADSLVASSRNLCTGDPPTFGTAFTGWNGAVQSGDVAATVKGCGSSGGGGGKLKAKIAVTHASSAKPRLKLNVKATNGSGGKARVKIKKTKLSLGKGLRFAVGGAFRKGFKFSPHRSGDSFGWSSKGVVVKLGKPGARLVERAKGGALRRTRAIAGKKLHFKLSVIDSNGKKTKLKLAATARP